MLDGRAGNRLELVGLLAVDLLGASRVFLVSLAAAEVAVSEVGVHEALVVLGAPASACAARTARRATRPPSRSATRRRGRAMPRASVARAARSASDRRRRAACAPGPARSWSSCRVVEGQRHRSHARFAGSSASFICRTISSALGVSATAPAAQRAGASRRRGRTARRTGEDDQRSASRKLLCQFRPRIPQAGRQAKPAPTATPRSIALSVERAAELGEASCQGGSRCALLQGRQHRVARPRRRTRELLRRHRDHRRGDAAQLVQLARQPVPRHAPWPAKW